MTMTVLHSVTVKDCVSLIRESSRYESLIQGASIHERRYDLLETLESLALSGLFCI